MKEVTAVIVNYQTPDLLQQAVESFKKIYPNVNTLIFDNGSRDHSKSIISSLTDRYPDTVKAHFEENNIYHGPALHKVLSRLIDTEYCFFLDSDTITKKGGFLEKGIEELSSNKKNYAFGYCIKANQRGFKDENGITIAVTPYLLLKCEHYSKFPQFIHHGQPVLFNFKEAQENGYHVIHHSMDRYIDHLWRGTASKYGYKLGVKGKIDYLLNRLGI